MKKRLMAMLLAAVLLVLCAAPAMAKAPKAKKTEYEGNGVVEVDFNSKKVKYKNAKVTVKDPNGKTVSVKILEKDNDDFTFKLKKFKADTKYTYTISGVRVGKSGKYGKVKGSFKTPSDTPVIKAVKYDAKDGEFEVDFATKVQFKGLKVAVKDADGKDLKVKRVEKGDDDLEIKVTGVKTGAEYTVSVSGVRVKGVGKYISVTKTFTA